MTWVPRVLPLALAGALHAAEPAPASAPPAAPEPRPIFLVPRPVPAPVDPVRALQAAPPLRPGASPLSERSRMLLREHTRVLAGKVMPARSPLPGEGAVADPGVVTMERYVVAVERDARVAVPPPESPVGRFIQTGRIFSAAGGAVTGDARFVKLPEFTRFETGVSFRF